MRRRIQRYRLATQLPPPVFSAQAAPGGTESTAYSYSFVASNSPTYALGTGALPNGLSLSSTGVLSGTPTLAGPYTFTVVATNASGSVSSVSQSVTIGSVGGSSSLNYTWVLPTDPATGLPDANIISQKVYWDTVRRAPFGGYANSHNIADGTTTSYVIPGLTSSTTYYINNTTTNASGESSLNSETVMVAP